MNSYFPRNTFIYKTNPLMKFLPFLMVVVLVFLKTDFATQIIIFGLVFFFWFLARIPVVRLKQILLSYVFMFALLFFINWIAEKNPLSLSDDKFSNSLLFGGNYQNDNGYVQTGGGAGILVITDKQNDHPTWAKLFANKNHGEPILQQIQTWLNTNTNTFSYQGYGLNNIRYEQLANNQYFAYFVKWYSVSNYSWVSALYVSNKLLIVILCSTIFTLTTSTVELTFAIEDILRPLKYLRFPANELAMILSIAIRFIPSLIAESLWIMKSQASRGIDFKNGNFLEKISALTSLIVPLFTISFLKADDLANAMTARSYNPRYARTRFRTFSLHTVDILGFIVVTFILSFFYYLTSVKFIFAPLGFYNVLVVLGR